MRQDPRCGGGHLLRSALLAVVLAAPLAVLAGCDGAASETATDSPPNAGVSSSDDSRGDQRVASEPATDAGSGEAELREATVQRTEVIVYEPSIPEGEEVAGECWAPSSAVQRPGAYRCSVENSIEDPCFAVPGDATLVVCGAGPFAEEPGFLLRVSEPLPDEEFTNPAHAWWVELADGTMCGFVSGATTGFEGERLNHHCFEQTWLMGDLVPGNVWTAKVVVVAEDGTGITDTELADVRTVWR